MLSHTHRYIFLHIPKTASESLRSIMPGADMDFNLNRESVNQILNIPHHDELGGRGRAVRKRLEPKIWNSYYKFAFVRNPWDRAVSSWKMLDKETTFPDFVKKIPELLKVKEKNL